MTTAKQKSIRKNPRRTLVARRGRKIVGTYRRPRDTKRVRRLMRRKLGNRGVKINPKSANWIITEDFINAGVELKFHPRAGHVTGSGWHKSKEVAIWGPRGAEKPNLRDLPLTFIIADDDGIVYYQGLANEYAEFAPLDMYGEPNDGATMIAYKKGDRWDML